MALLMNVLAAVLCEACAMTAMRDDRFAPATLWAMSALWFAFSAGISLSEEEEEA
jgi:hypothetical protein